MLRSLRSRPTAQLRALPTANTSTINSVRVMSSSAPKRGNTPGSGSGPKEDSSVGPMYRFERDLPKLPVPTLEETADRYLKSLQPYHQSPSPFAPNSPLPSFKQSQDAVASFLQSPLVKTLQCRLEARAESEPSWLAKWWDETAYFGWRGPVVPGVNYFYVHKDDKSRKTGPKRAASLVRALMYFREMTESQQLEPEMARKTPLAMSSYKYLFNATRLPTPTLDSAKKYDPSTNNHVVVVRKNKFYKVAVVDDKGQWLSENELEGMFKQVIELAGETADPIPVGALTTADRDVWTKSRLDLIEHSELNSNSLETIGSAIIIVSLDDSKPITREQISWDLWVGDGKSRWFDKHQLIVFDNGKSGFNGEHSCMDGTPTSRLNDWLLRSLKANKIDLGSSSRPVSALPAIEPLNFDVPASVQSAIKSTVKAHSATMAKHALAVLQYDGYGSSLIKTFKLSPDSYTQLIMGLAYYKMTGEVAPTYESAQTRKYKLGRTEVIRSTTAEALEFYKKMESTTATDVERLKAMQVAGAKHAKLAQEAADGRGVDRHLFGLKKLLQEGEQLPELYQDPTFAKSSNWVLSTSQLTSEFFEGWGYGEVVDEGYGLAYSVNPRSLTFTITSMRERPESVGELRRYLEQACTEVREVMENGLKVQQAGEGEAPKAKL